MNSHANDQTFWPQVMAVVSAGCLLLLDKGLIDFTIFDQLTDRHAGFITRPKSNTRQQVTQVLSKTAMIHDSLIVLGSPQAHCQHPMRLVEVLFHGKWYRYLTTVTDPALLPAECVVALDDQRWRIEDAFNAIQRLLGLAYCHVGSLKGLQRQLCAAPSKTSPWRWSFAVCTTLPVTIIRGRRLTRWTISRVEPQIWLSSNQN